MHFNILKFDFSWVILNFSSILFSLNIFSSIVDFVFGGQLHFTKCVFVSNPTYTQFSSQNLTPT